MNCQACDGYGNVWNNADPTSGQRVDCVECQPVSSTEGPWFVSDGRVLAVVAREGHPVICELTATDDRSECGGEALANANLIAAAPNLRGALKSITDLFAHPGENSVERFDRLAAMFRKDTGYTAPGKDQPMSGTVSAKDQAEIATIYDAWYQEKIDGARAILAALPPAGAGERAWTPHLDYAGEPMREGQFRDPPEDAGAGDVGYARAIEDAAKVAECAFDDRPRSRVGHPSQMDWEDGYRDGTRASAAAIRALSARKDAQ